MIDYHVSIAGFFVGLFVGLSGVGSSSLMLPILVLFMGVSPLIAVGTDLAYSVPTKIVGTLVHARQRTINWKLVLLLAIGGVPAAIVGVVSLGYLKAHMPLDRLNVDLKHGLGILMFVVAAFFIVSQLLRKYRQKDRRPVAVGLRRRAHLIVAVGAIVGLLVSITSIGAGSITMTALVLILPTLRVTQLVGSDIAFAAIIVPVATLGHFTLGSVNLPLTLSLLLGSVPGVLIGSRVCGLLPDRIIKPALAGALMLAGSRMF